MTNITNAPCQLCGTTRQPLFIDYKCPDCTKYIPITEDELNELLICANTVEVENGYHTVSDFKRLIPRAVQTIRSLQAGK